MKSIIPTSACLALAISGGSATAANNWPAKVVGTWNMTANQSTVALDITEQGTTGPCHTIGGTFATDDIGGYYCPDSGRISFFRYNSSNGVSSQSYTGNLSQPGSTVYMCGTFEADGPGGGVPGEYSFVATLE